ncbi:hypothetical protein LMG23992_00178 [Cupriavidus laharis]|uniref:Flp family type IVb pilin n=1 Tax=Cupriavidus laharis TaxID=151654 RepID=A0ABN7XYB9_9BURK|nr:Flp family type IVb pilin [Cupriavidus laharis]CAG9165032.1 hypothetical protein LMG23992_00178 [Cupriavidus laharis]
MRTLIAQLKAFQRDDNGVTAIEYGLIAALIAIVIITSLTAIGTSLSNVFSYIATELP